MSYISNTSSGGSAAGSTGAIQFNTSGTFDADSANLFYTKASGILTALEIAGISPTAPTLTVTPSPTGSSTWTYQVLAINNGYIIAGSAYTTITNGSTTLGGGNKNSLSWTAVAGATSYYVVVIASPSNVENGLIQTTSSLSFDDVGASSGDYFGWSAMSGYLISPNGLVVGDGLDTLNSNMKDAVTVGDTTISCVETQNQTAITAVAQYAGSTHFLEVTGIAVFGYSDQASTLTSAPAVQGGFIGGVSNHTSPTTYSSVMGLIAGASQLNSGSVTTVAGIETSALSQAGTVTLQTGAFITTNIGGGTITENSGIVVQDQSGVGTNNYALHILNQSAAAYPNNWAIKVDGGMVEFDGQLLKPLMTPSSSSAAGVQGQIEWDANYLYVCTATNTWKRAALSTF